MSYEESVFRYESGIRTHDGQLFEQTMLDVDGGLAFDLGCGS